MLTGKSDIQDSTTKFSITSEWKSNFFNLLPIKSNFQGINSIAAEGYITSNSNFTFNLYKDFSDSSIMSFTFGGTEDNLIVGNTVTRFLGSTNLSNQPLGTVSDPDSDGRRRFTFIVYFPYIYGQDFSIGVQSEGKDIDWEISRVSLGIRESVSVKTTNIKTI